MTDADVFLLADQFVDQLAVQQPMLATQMGISGRDDEWGSHDPAGWQEIEMFLNRTRLEIQDLPPSDLPWERLGRRVLDDHLNCRLEFIEQGEPLRDLNNIASPVQGFRETFDLMPRYSENDWLNIASRLGTLGEAIEGYIACLSEGRRRGLVAAKRQVHACIEQCRVNSSATSFFDQLGSEVQDVQITKSLQRRVAAGVVAAKSGYARLADHLEIDYLPDSLTEDGVGLERYRVASRRFLLTEIDHEAVYHWGWQEVAELRQRMGIVGRQIDSGRSFQEIVHLLRTGPGYVVRSEGSFLNRMREVQVEALERLHGRMFDVPDRVRALDVRMAPNGSTLGAYYIQPSEDFSRPGCVWYAKAKGTTVFPLFDEVTTAYHEGFPGHHLQIGVQMCLGDQLTRAHRLAIWYDGYGEGWALYAERLMGELGFLDRPEFEFGLLASQMMRACRVVIDIGMHLGLTIPPDAPFHPGEAWTFKTAARLLTDYGLLQTENARSDLTRYLGWPGQAISYKVGEQFILDLRTEAEHKEWYTLKEFHRRVLASGPVGLDHLKELILSED